MQERNILSSHYTLRLRNYRSRVYSMIRTHCHRSIRSILLYLFVLFKWR